MQFLEEVKTTLWGLIDALEHLFERFTSYNMNPRVLRFPISETGYEYVITNLPTQDFSAEEIKKLYAMRWAIETWARLILYNFCEVITSHITIKKCTKKHTYQINYTFAIHICRYFISKMAEKSPPDVEALIRKEILPIILLFLADENTCLFVLLN